MVSNRTCKRTLLQPESRQAMRFASQEACLGRASGRCLPSALGSVDTHSQICACVHKENKPRLLDTLALDLRAC